MKYLEAGGLRVQVIGSALTDAREMLPRLNVMQVADMVEAYLKRWDDLNAGREVDA